LSVTEAEIGCDFVPIRGAQVLLVEEPFFQFEDLVVGEGGSRLPLLLGLLPAVEQVQMTA